eukprot:TRINITY_DN21583_c0_g1_i1.p1 TRINITY_DN21583_c0_g1~~TRINITY_DN21583_c0_g1_i1.p1  ORF type:complete len:322 (+),score=74.49 TRINITY_DN21583_c0_g1_i1:140-1105(+)
MGNQYFSVTAMFIMFREVLEAAVIISVLLQLLSKIGADPKFKKQVWCGAGLGFLLSVIVGVIFVAIFYTLEKEVFEGHGEQIFEGVIMMIAVVMITVLAFGMLKMMEMEKRWHAKLSSATELALSGSKKYAIFFVAFTAVLREGIESVLFLTGVGSDNWRAIPIAGIVGALLGVAFGYFIFFSLKPVALKWFFYISTTILLVIAAGLFAHGIHEFQEAQWWGNFELEDKTTPWHNKPLWNICKCCDSKDQGFFELAKALVYYTCEPSFMELIAYIGYWVVIAAIFLYKMFRGTLLDYKTEENLKEAEKPVAAAPAAADLNV